MTDCVNNRLPVVIANGELPSHFRLVNLVRLPCASGQRVYNQAMLYHDRVRLKVSWQSELADTRLQHGCIVALEGAPSTVPRDGVCVSIARLHSVEQPLPALNQFHMVPPSWLPDRELLTKAAALWERLDRPLKHLVNAVLWDAGRFYRFVTGPSSPGKHPPRSGSNFRHSIEMALQAAKLARENPETSLSVVIAAALLFDAGKADDFRVSLAGCRLSERGFMIGYQHTILEWLAVAKAQIDVPDGIYLALVHALIAGRRASGSDKSTEAAILSSACRISGAGRNGLSACSSKGATLPRGGGCQHEAAGRFPRKCRAR